MTRVLVIDDCEDFRESVFDILEDAGFEVAIADGPESAANTMQEQTFDVVLCDLVMPVDDDEFQSESAESQNDSAMVGVHTIHALAKKCPNVPIVAISGALTGAPLAAMRSFGAVKCLSKPFGRVDLLEAVDAAMRMKAST